MQVSNQQACFVDGNYKVLKFTKQTRNQVLLNSSITCLEETHLIFSLIKKFLDRVW